MHLFQGRATLVAKLVISGILFSISITFVLRVVVLTKPIILVILFLKTVTYF